jgi:hypothetical protein
LITNSVLKSFLEVRFFFDLKEGLKTSNILAFAKISKKTLIADESSFLFSIQIKHSRCLPSDSFGVRG